MSNCPGAYAEWVFLKAAWTRVKRLNNDIHILFMCHMVWPTSIIFPEAHKNWQPRIRLQQLFGRERADRQCEQRSPRLGLQGFITRSPRDELRALTFPRICLHVWVRVWSQRANITRSLCHIYLWPPRCYCKTAVTPLAQTVNWLKQLLRRGISHFCFLLCAETK